MKFVVLLLSVVVIVSSNTGGSINYDEQQDWKGSCNLEGSKSQSPVDVRTPEKVGETLPKGELIQLSAGMV